MAVTAVRRSLPILGLLLLLALPDARAEDTLDVQRALLAAARRDLPLTERLDAAATILAAEEATDAGATARAALGLLPEAPETAGWLVLRASDAGWIPDHLRARLAEAVAGALAAEDLQPHDRARLHATGVLVGRRPDTIAAELTRLWPPPDLVRAVLRRDLVDAAAAATLPADAEAARGLIETHRAAATLLDRATLDDPAGMAAGMDGLMDLGAAAVPLLLHEARLGALGSPAGRMPRAIRAIVVLGMLGDRRATPILARALASPSGWVRVAAATALGDLGDPAGAVPLAAHLTNTGDVFRARDQWEYPGKSSTTVPASEWRSIDYFVVDVAAADSLLRLGARNAAGYIIHKQLDPSAKNARIRVYQDSVDALRRAFGHTEAKGLVAAYNVDAGLPQRDAAFLALARWWHLHRDDGDIIQTSLDENDEGFRRGARALVDKLQGTDVRQFMITKPALEILGTAVTPTLIESLQAATRGSAKAEIAKTLAMVRDPRAVPALLGLLEDRLPFVRAAGAEALGPYLASSDREVLAAAYGGVRKAIEDPKAGPRLGALKAMVSLPPGLRRWSPAEAIAKARPASPSSDWQRAETVFRFVQEGEAHWPAIEAGLAHKDRHVREAWWRLLRAGLDVPAHRHDPHPTIDRAKRRIDKQAALAARSARSLP